MKIRANTLIAGPTVIIHPGQEAEVPDAFGQDLIQGGYAVRIGAVVIETAEAKPAVETAEATPTKRKR